MVYETSQYPFHAASISFRSFASCAEICSPLPPAADDSATELDDALLTELLLGSLDDEAAEDVVIDLLLALVDAALNSDAEVLVEALADSTADDDTALVIRLGGGPDTLGGPPQPATAAITNAPQARDRPARPRTTQVVHTTALPTPL